MTASHRFEDHVGEVELHLEGDTLEDVFAEAARALTSLFLAEGTPTGAPGPPERVRVTARDRAALLVEWLNELVFRADTAGKACVDVAFEALGDTELVALVREADAPLVPAIKAATYHDVRVGERAGGGFEARVVLDS